MPKIRKTILPRVKKALKDKGVLRTLWACLRAPAYLIADYRKVNRNFKRPAVQDEFDLRYGVETSIRVHLTDLKIDSPNWVYAGGYWPTSTEIIHEALSALPIRYEDFVFIDFGSGKGRVLLQASDFPFRRIVGVEFSSELHNIAVSNIGRYKSDGQKCRQIESVCLDFTQFEIPPEPLVAFLYNPSSEPITAALASNIARSLAENPRELWVVYVTPTYNVFEGGQPLDLRKLKATEKYAIFSNVAKALVAAQSV
jgi:hypothetical protein